MLGPTGAQLTMSPPFKGTSNRPSQRKLSDTKENQFFIPRRGASILLAIDYGFLYALRQQ